MMANECFFRENFHMSKENFDLLFNLVKDELVPKRNTRPKDAIPPKLKLALVIEFLACGDLQRHIASCYRVSKQYTGIIIDLVCEAICRALKDTVPEHSESMFLNVANGFNRKWNFPNCIGAIDGKHVAIKAPPKSGSIFYNYKGFHSLSLLAICDASYKFTYLDIGAYGSEGDCSFFRNSKFGSDVLNDRLCFPDNATVNGVKLPFCFVADDAFPLCKRIMKPYSGKNLSDEEIIFNYRLSRARRCIENAFGILCVKWACLKKLMFCNPDRAQRIIVACCLLHNFLIQQCSVTYCPPSYIDRIDNHGNLIEGEWRNRIVDSQSSLYHTSFSVNAGRSTDYAKYVRNILKVYVNSEIGSVPWQRRAAFIE
ncbi:putative nuclease HARBI1 [Sabethes cyaneus]|uniref:putative nuclease HARBI1 n=1 Tax=Sabethes cyaneus TaxID=53552 RepID=UPI00237D816A|nr:putative nuclease HARBI1 [Sabethes cyaneus]